MRRFRSPSAEGQSTQEPKQKQKEEDEQEEKERKEREKQEEDERCAKITDLLVERKTGRALEAAAEEWEWERRGRGMRRGRGRLTRKRTLGRRGRDEDGEGSSDNETENAPSFFAPPPFTPTSLFSPDSSASSTFPNFGPPFSPTHARHSPLPPSPFSPTFSPALASPYPPPSPFVTHQSPFATADQSPFASPARSPYAHPSPPSPYTAHASHTRSPYAPHPPPSRAGVHAGPGPAPRYIGTAPAHSWWDRERGGDGEASEHSNDNKVYLEESEADSGWADGGGLSEFAPAPSPSPPAHVKSGDPYANVASDPYAQPLPLSPVSDEAGDPRFRFPPAPPPAISSFSTLSGWGGDFGFAAPPSPSATHQSPFATADQSPFASPARSSHAHPLSSSHYTAHAPPTRPPYAPHPPPSPDASPLPSQAQAQPGQALMLPSLAHMYQRSLSAPCRALPGPDMGAGVHVGPGPAPRYTGTAPAHSWWDQERGSGGEASERDPTNAGTWTTTVARITSRPTPPPFLLSPSHSSIRERRPSLDEPFMPENQSQSSESQSSMSDTEQHESPNLYSQASSSAVGPPKREHTRTLTTPYQSATLHAVLAQTRFPTTTMREEIGRSIGLSARKVQIWFQTQRQKQRIKSGRQAEGSEEPWLSGPPPRNWEYPRGSAYRRASQSSLDLGSGGESVDSSFSSSSLQEGIVPGHNSKTHRLILQELDLTGSVAMDRYPADSGGSADIYDGTLRGSKVAVKIYRRMHSDPQELDRTSRALYEAVRSWSTLSHPNVLPFLGVSLDLGLSPALITPLCSSGPIMKYLKSSPKDPMQRLQMMIDVAGGLEYLHAEGIIHGNLSTKKVLTHENGIPVICGYGMSTILGPSANSTMLFACPIRYSAPEYFSDETGTSSVRTKAGDIYAFAMVTLEILSGLEPYHHLSTEHTVFKHILLGGRPIRTYLDPQVITKRIWNLLTWLWDQTPSSRPEMTDVVLALVKIRDDKSIDAGDSEPDLPEPIASTGNQEMMSSSGEEMAFEETALVGFHGRDLSGRIKQDDQYPFAGGGNSNIYRGKLTRSDGRKIRVAIKMLRMSDDGSGQADEMLRRMKREVDVWSRLKHRNVLPFIGVCDDLAPLPVLISPFYKFGHVAKYISNHPDVSREELALGVASGLQFLHENNVVHGDLKVQNVLVSKHGVPCISDFGISKIVSRRGFTTSNVGTAPYMAPELFFVIDGSETGSHVSSSPSTTTSSDVYSYALLVLEILTAQRPKARPSRPIITTSIRAELRPKRTDYDPSKVSQGLWSVLDRCWAFEPVLRPSISEVLDGLNRCFLPTGSRA